MPPHICLGKFYVLNALLGLSKERHFNAAKRWSLSMQRFFPGTTFPWLDLKLTLAEKKKETVFNRF
jgi:hypothetical protein